MSGISWGHSLWCAPRPLGPRIIPVYPATDESGSLGSALTFLL